MSNPSSSLKNRSVNVKIYGTEAEFMNGTISLRIFSGHNLKIMPGGSTVLYCKNPLVEVIVNSKEEITSKNSASVLVSAERNTSENVP
jgi:hypothetical protein